MKILLQSKTPLYPEFVYIDLKICRKNVIVNRWADLFYDDSVHESEEASSLLPTIAIRILWGKILPLIPTVLPYTKLLYSSTLTDEGGISCFLYGGINSVDSCRHAARSYPHIL